MPAKVKQNKVLPKRGVSQRKPMARQAKTARKSPSVAANLLRNNAHWLFVIALAVGLGFLLFVGYQAVAASSVFEVKKIDIAGNSRVSKDNIEKIARLMTTKSGVWNADLNQMRLEIEKIQVVKSAVVSRVLPDGLRIRVTEREPKAVVRLQNDKFILVDEDARVLGTAHSSEAIPPVLLGWNEANDDAARKSNQDRIRVYRQMLDEFGKLDLSKRAATIDLSDLQEAQVNVLQDVNTVPIFLGNADFGIRLKRSLDVLQKLSANGEISQISKITIHDEQSVTTFKTENPGDIARLNNGKNRNK
ncbi:MAG: FtsQ-type POTRA domain-containing protein [Pyrinomonadaceae bacterium]|nr:FtsQ-type POTRA domain-containing protein [Pyrinomonadaceae bacterium]